MRIPLRRRAGDAALREHWAPYARTRLPGRRTPWREADWCAVDLELTGLDPVLDEIIAFGAIPISDGRVQLHAAVSGLVRPTREIGEAAIRIHGIRATDLELAPSLPEALDPLIEAITGRLLVVHSAVVEETFLGRVLKAYGRTLRGPVADTELLGRLWLHDRREQRVRGGLGLGELARTLRLPAERAHEALADALTTAQVFVALATHLEAVGVETVGSLTRGRARLEALRMFDP